MTWRAIVVTLFPELFPGPLGASLAGRALGTLWSCGTVDIRAHALDKHRSVDDTPAGGGPGMVMRADVLARALDAAAPASDPRPRILLTPRGRPLTQGRVRAFAGGPGLVLVCGRYEGVDERVGQHLADRELSIGDYVLSGGELGAAVILDAVARLIPGALGNEASTRQESFTVTAAVEAGGADSTCASGGLLDYPHYTRPADFRGLQVPEVLVSGNHEEIRRWRRRTALEKTLRNRPDLLKGAALGDEDKKLLARITDEQP